MHRVVTPRTRKVLYTLLIFFALLSVRLLSVQLGSANALSKLASDQYKTFASILPRRGIIYDSNLRKLAVSINLSSVFLDPFIVEDKDKAARDIAGVLGLEEKDILEKLDQKKRFIWLTRKVEPEIERALRRLNIKGVGFIKESNRAYPHGMLLSHVIGFVGLDNEGLEGLELKFDKHLKGTIGWIYTIRDAKRREVHGYEYKEIPPADGNDIVLTIDSMIQSVAERELDKAVTKYNADGGSVIVMDPYTGDVIALANRPTYDLNNVNGYPVENRRNRAISDFFEPGSSFKIVTASAAIEENMIGLDDEIFCENGEFKWTKHTYHDTKPHGWLAFKDIIKYSSNIGTMKVALKLGETRLYRYIKRFGFGKKTDIDLPGEVEGISRSPDQWSKLSLCSISMGQEITVTAMQLACALSSVANGGCYVRPRIIDRIQDKSGNVLERFEVEKRHRVMSEESAMKLRRILRGVVEEGTAKKAEIEGYFPAGKTGTAQKIEPNGTYSHSKYTASFIGLLPYDDPKFVTVVILDEPRPQYYGGTVCAPVFKNVAEELMRYYKIEKQVGIET
ncbi:MAG: penicillin-binding transpeptidase domain-containing protein [Candidatus Omnitrophota bacterium]